MPPTTKLFDALQFGFELQRNRIQTAKVVFPIFGAPIWFFMQPDAGLRELLMLDLRHETRVEDALTNAFLEEHHETLMPPAKRRLHIIWRPAQLLDLREALLEQARDLLFRLRHRHPLPTLPPAASRQPTRQPAPRRPSPRLSVPSS